MTWQKLEPRTIHVWSLTLTAAAEVIDAYAALLADDERERRRRLMEGRIRDEFTLARGALRILLGRYLAREPASIEFAYGTRGKPALADPGLRPYFNLAHSDGLAVYGFAEDRELGIDVERARDIPEMKQIARRFFAGEEADILESLPADERSVSFYRAWTRKEAYVKAVGDGLHTPLASFCVTLRPEETARLTTLNGSALAASAWQLHHLNPAGGYVGALAYSGTRQKVIAMNNASPAKLMSGDL